MGNGAPRAGVEQLWGTWRIVRFTVTVDGESSDVFGRRPQGYLSYGQDGRMLVLLVKSERPRPDDMANVTDEQRAELFKGLIAYGGTYTFDGKAVTHHVDVSANENWTGTTQVRNVEFDAGRLVLTTGPQPSPIDGRVMVGVIVWEKVTAGAH